MSVRSCKRIYVKLNQIGSLITIWQPMFGGANSLETVVDTGLSSKTFMDGMKTLTGDGVATYVRTPDAATPVSAGPDLAACTVIADGNPFAGWRLIADTNGDAGFSTAYPLTVGV